MNWNQLHSIIVKMSSQTAIPQLNSIGLEALKQLIGKSNYRLYVNHCLKGDEDLTVALIHSKVQETEEERDLSSKLGRSSWGYDNVYETENFVHFIVSSQNQCFALVSLRKDDAMPKAQIVEILRTLVTMWSRLLNTLYFYQRDSLTGLLNRNILFDTINGNNFDSTVFEESVGLNSSSERRMNVGLPETHAVALIDVDNFKSINDSWGHSIGDEVLIKLANLMELTFRDCDVICRYGGEEFAVYLRYVSKSKADEILNRLRHRIEESVFPKIDKVTVTIGYTLTFPGILASELIERADSALYLGKNNGKNQVVAAEDHQQLWSQNDNFDIGEIELF